MYRAVQVIVAIAIVVSAVEICVLVVDYFEPRKIQDSAFLENAKSRAELRWKVYWFSGLPLAVVGFLLRRRREVAGYALFIGGIYLMLLGNNAGFLATGHIVPRIATSVITFVGLVAVIWNERWTSDA